MKQPSYRKIFEHPDREELINKLIIDQPISDIHEWLAAKYTAVSESKFVLAESALKSFKDNYLDFYNEMQADLSKTRSAVNNNTTDQLDLIVKGSPAYKDAMLRVANSELDLTQMLSNLAINIETRMAQLYDTVQADPDNINTKLERLLIDYAETFGNLLDKIYKFKEVRPDLVIQHNVNVQGVDPHISAFHDVIKEVLAQMDLESSQYFMEVFNEKFSKLRPVNPDAGPSQEMKMAEVKLLNETINKKLT